MNTMNGSLIPVVVFAKFALFHVTLVILIDTLERLQSRHFLKPLLVSITPDDICDSFQLWEPDW